MKIIIYSLLLIISHSYIVVPFKTLVNETALELNYMKEKFFNDIYINIQIGSNKQEIPIQLRLHAYYFYIIDEAYDGIYKVKKFESPQSTSYKPKNPMDNYYSEDYTNGILSTDDFYFGNIKIEQFNFINAKQIALYQHITQSGAIGLNLKQSGKSFRDDVNFLENLKNKKLFSNYIFSIIYTNENEGFFFLGEHLYKTKESNYTEQCEKKYKLQNNYFIDEWYIVFDEYKIGNEKFEKSINAFLYPELGVIISNQNYHKSIENFFKNKLCEKKEFNPIGMIETYLELTYTYYVCDKSLNEKEFPTLSIVTKKLNLTFELTYKELFSEYKDKKYFLVVFPEEDIYSVFMILGKPFMKKYDFSFDRYEQFIYPYDINGPRYNKVWDTFWFVLKILLIIFFIVVLILAVYTYYIKIKMPRKKRAFEIEDNFDYVPSENRETKLLI